MSSALWFLAGVTVGLALAILVMDWWVIWRLESHRKRALAGYQPDTGHQCDDARAVQEVSRQAGAAHRAAKRPPPPKFE